MLSSGDEASRSTAPGSREVDRPPARWSTRMIFTRSGGHLSKLGMIRAEVKDGSESADIHG
jgi:hypothetical protein